MEEKPAYSTFYRLIEGELGRLKVPEEERERQPEDYHAWELEGIAECLQEMADMAASAKQYKPPDNPANALWLAAQIGGINAKFYETVQRRWPS